MNFICAETSTGSSIVIYIVLIVALVAMLILPYFSQRKKNQEYMKMLEAIKVGDLVKTAGGIIGRVTKISDKGEIKTVILETGSKSEKSFMEFDMSMIYCVLKSSKAEKVEEEKTAENNKEESEKTAENELLESPVAETTVSGEENLTTDAENVVANEEKKPEEESKKPTKKPAKKAKVTTKTTKTTKTAKK